VQFGVATLSDCISVNGLVATSLGIVLGVRVFAAPAPVARDSDQSAAVDTLHLQ
jgi:hypothetical protein